MLQTRPWKNHLGRGLSLTTSAFRRSVAEFLSIASANDIKEVAAIAEYLDAPERGASGMLNSPG